MPNKDYTPRSEKGFTLTELLLVSVLLGLLSLSITKVLASVRTASKEGHVASNSIVEANRVIQIIQNALSNIGTNGLQGLNANGSSALRFSQRYVEVSPLPENTNTSMLRISSKASSFANLGIEGLIGDVEIRLYQQNIDNTAQLILEIWPNFTRNQSATNPFVQSGNGLTQNNNNSQNNSMLLRKAVSNHVDFFAVRFKTPQGWANTAGTVYGFNPKLIEVTLGILDPEQKESQIYRSALRVGQGLR